MRLRFIWNYQGHNDGFFSGGPGWWQITFPPSRKSWRCSLIGWRPFKADPTDHSKGAM